MRVQTLILTLMIPAIDGTLPAAPGQSTEVCRLAAAAGDTLMIENDFGRVRVIPWDRPEIQAQIRIIAGESERLANVRVACATSQRTHFIRAAFFDYSAESVYLDVHAPDSVSLVVSGANPAVELAGLRGQVRVQTLTGRITAYDLTGPASLQSIQGSILFHAGVQPEWDILLGTGTGAITCRIQTGLNLRGWLRAGGRIAWGQEMELAQGFLERQIGIGGPLLGATSQEGSIAVSVEDSVPLPQISLPPPADPPVTDDSTGGRDAPAPDFGGEDETRPPISGDYRAADPVPGPEPTTIRAPEAYPDEADPQAGYSLKVNVDWVYVNASVYDARTRRAVAHLSRDQFELKEDGLVQRIDRFDSTEAPFSLVLLLDVSGSTKSYLDMVKQASIEFTRQLNPGDRVAVATFNSRTRLRQDFTSDRRELAGAIQGIRSGGGTAFYDALYETVTEFLSGVEGRQAVVVFSDGVDNQLTDDIANGSTIRFRDLYRTVQDGDALIYTIFLDTEAEYGQGSRRGRSPGGILGDIILGRGGIGLGGRPDPAYREAREQLRMLTEQTGGRMYAPDSADELLGVFGEIAADLRVQYTLGYASANPRRDGQWRELRVQIKNRPDLEVRARKGYYAPRDAGASLNQPSTSALADIRRFP